MTEGRWFRVYALQVRDHPKFRSLTGVELGAWFALRSEAELRADVALADRAEALLVLKRRSIPRPGTVLDRLVALRLFDIDDLGRVHVHDRTDHDRSEMTPAQRQHRRDHRTADGDPSCPFCQVEVWDRKAGAHGAWQPRGGIVDSPRGHSTVDRASKQPQPTATEAAPATESTPPRGPMLLASELPSEDDSATIACRQLFDTGKWLSDREYVAAWEEMDRSYTPAWVQAEITPAFAACLESRGKVLPWDLKRMTEQRLAERSRAEERDREQAIARRAALEEEQRQEAVASMSEEERERQSLMRRAIGLWVRGGRKGQVPEQVDELRDWIAANERQGAPV